MFLPKSQHLLDRPSSKPTQVASRNDVRKAPGPAEGVLSAGVKELRNLDAASNRARLLASILLMEVGRVNSCCRRREGEASALRAVSGLSKGIIRYNESNTSAGRILLG